MDRRLSTTARLGSFAILTALTLAALAPSLCAQENSGFIVLTDAQRREGERGEDRETPKARGGAQS
ncbi:MAG: hypothetical protein AAFS10_26700, partial [Myxococcota bacterium]